MNFFYVMQEKFNFIYDVEHHLGDLDLIIRGIDREAATTIGSTICTKPTETMCGSTVLQGRDNKSSELSIPWISGSLLVTCLSLRQGQ